LRFLAVEVGDAERLLDRREAVARELHGARVVAHVARADARAVGELVDHHFSSSCGTGPPARFMSVWSCSTAALRLVEAVAWKRSKAARMASSLGVRFTGSPPPSGGTPGTVRPGSGTPSARPSRATA